MFNTTRSLITVLLPVLLAGCAMRVAPSGGDRDTTTARVSGTYPASGTRNVTDKSVRIFFDDYVDRSVRSAVTVQPSVPVNVDYAGDEITVQFKENLEANTTYVVTLGTEYSDLRGNKPSQAESIIFSTGPDIDSGRITGTVEARNAPGLVLFVYGRADTLTSAFSPQTSKPRYRVPIGSSGMFVVNGLANGTYRVVVARDGNQNDMVDASEEYGMATADVTVPQDSVQKLRIYVGAALDITAPSATRVRATNTTTLEVLFSEPVVITTAASPFTVTDSTGRTAPVAGWFQRKKNAPEVLIRLASPMAPGTPYSLAIDTALVADTTGYPAVRPAKPLSFRGTDRERIRSVQIESVSVRDSATIAADSAVMLVFSDAMDTTVENGGGSSRFVADADTIPALLKWEGMNRVRAAPSRPLQYRKTYAWSFTAASMRSVSGDTLPDTVLTARITIADRIDSGTVEGSFTSVQDLGSPVLLRVLDKNGIVLRTIPVRSGEAWSIKGLPPGDITFQVFVDRNGNGVYDYGRVRPFELAEWRYLFDRVVTVRPRWTVDGIVLSIP